MSQKSLTDALTGTSLLDTDSRLRWLEARWVALRPYERSYALIDLAMRLGRLTATTSNHAALAGLVGRFRELETTMMASLGRL